MNCKKRRKARLASKAAAVHGMESGVTIRNKNWSHGTLVTGNGEKSEISKHLDNWRDEENNNLCTQKDSSKLKQKKHRHKERKDNSEASRTLHEVPAVENGEDSGISSKGNKNMSTHKATSNFKQKKHKHKEREFSTEDNRTSLAIPATSNGEESESHNEEIKNICTQTDSSNINRKKHKHRERKVMCSKESEHEFACPTCFKNFDDRMDFVNHLLLHREENLFSVKSLKKFHRKNRLASEAAVVHSAESNVNTRRSCSSPVIPETTHGEESESTDYLGNWKNQENKNWKQKKHKHKHKESNVDTEDSMASHEMPVTASVKELESSNAVSNVFTQKDRLHGKWKKKKDKERDVNTTATVLSHEVPLTVGGEQLERRNAENGKILEQKYSMHVKCKKQNNKDREVNTVETVVTYETPLTADIEQPESRDEENSSRVKRKKQKHKDRKINIEDSMSSHEIPGTANEEETENRNQENVIVCTQKDSLHVKQKKQKIVVNRVNTEESTVSHEMPLTANGGEPRTLNQENKDLWTQKDSSHLKQKKLKNKKREVNIGERIESNDRPLTANVELDSMNQENHLFSQKDSSRVNEKNQKNKENKVNTEGSMPLNELLVTANEQLHGSSNEEDNNMCTEEYSIHKKWSTVNTEGSMASPKILVTANGGKPESRNEENKKLTLSGEVPKSHGKENKNVSTQKDISHVEQKNQKHKESEVNTGSIKEELKKDVTVEYKESKSSNEENLQNLCKHRDSSDWKRIKLKHKKKKVMSLKQLLNKSPFITQSEREFTCHTCFKKFANRRNLVNHLLIHRDEEDFSCGLCAPCESSFSSKPSLQEHIRTHMKEDTFECTECSKHFSGVDNLRRHMQRHNEVKATGEKPESRNQENISSRISHEVPVTTKEVESKSCNENEHKKSKVLYLAKLLQKSLLKTQSEHKFTCPKCSKNFDNRPNFVRHLLIHRDEKEFPCALCEKNFKLKQSLKVHMRTHMNEKPFECSVCSENFSDANNLRRHMLIHNKEKEFICATCSKAFAMKHQLKKHIMSHMGLKLSPCPHCGKTFNYQYCLQIHLNACKKLNPITCSVCLKQVRTNYHLERHMRTHK